MKARSSLLRRLLLGLTVFGLLLAAATFLHGYVVNERAEQMVWNSLLGSELEHHLQRRVREPDYHWSDTDNLHLYGPERAAPPAFAGLAPGVHDDVPWQGREFVVLVQDDAEGHRHVLALDITELEQTEGELTLFILSYALLLALLLGIIAAWGLRRLLRPLTTLADRIQQLQADAPAQRLPVAAGDSREIAVIANALNDYLARNEAFIERERLFIDSASHELRTPVAVIAGALDLALEQPDLPDAARRQVERALRSVRDVDPLITLLLVLAKTPERLSRSNEPVQVEALIPQIVADHRHLLADKDLQIDIEPLPPCTVHAPPAVLRVAIGNLLRNAIENSDRGHIRLQLLPDATLVIDDPGHGMSAEEVSRLYAQLARGGGRDGGGIGMDLLARLCEHLGWRLHFESDPGRGTRSVLQMRPG
ncbi:sensor histidine kinase [Luteimonas sp. e5]